ncbi:hypothetical protein PTR22_25330, partial [Serratia ureilytica]
MPAPPQGIQLPHAVIAPPAERLTQHGIQGAVIRRQPQPLGAAPLPGPLQGFRLTLIIGAASPKMSLAVNIYPKLWANTEQIMA